MFLAPFAVEGALIQDEIPGALPPGFVVLAGPFFPGCVLAGLFFLPSSEPEDDELPKLWGEEKC